MISKPSGWRIFPPAYETVDKGHGRIEIRKIWVSSDLKGYLGFPYQEQIARIERITTDLQGENLRHDVVHAITSIPKDRVTAQEFLGFNRCHWGIENRLHWVRDVTFDEDRCTIRTNSAPRVMATFRSLAIGLLRLDGQKNIAKALRYYAGKPHKALGLMGL
jgi:predicted transposase YbfD/YdcC